MTNMNPFEIRLEILKMAKELQMDQYFAERDAANLNWENEKAKKEQNYSEELLEFPDVPSSEDILKRAKELYAFIQEKS